MSKKAGFWFIGGAFLDLKMKELKKNFSKKFVLDIRLYLISGKPLNLFNPAQANQAIRQMKEICEKSRTHIQNQSGSSLTKVFWQKCLNLKLG